MPVNASYAIHHLFCCWSAENKATQYKTKNSSVILPLFTDIDECKDKTACSIHAFCTNIPASYHCKCKEGYAGNGKVCKGIIICLSHSAYNVDIQSVFKSCGSKCE